MKAGDAITVHFADGTVYCTRVHEIDVIDAEFGVATITFTHTLGHGGVAIGHVLAAREGVDWCAGWGAQAMEALVAAHALANQESSARSAW